MGFTAMKTILGIDPGLSGGLVLLNKDRELVNKWVMPTLKHGSTKVKDLPKLRSILSEAAESADHAYLEQYGMRRRQSMQSAAKTGVGFGYLEAMLVCFGMSYTVVAPNKWCAEIHKGISGDKAKEKSRIAVSRLFPNEELLATEKSSVMHEGLMDALLIAEFGVREMF